MSFTEILFFTTTADDEREWQALTAPPPLRFDPASVMPPGTYRVVDGRLYRIINAAAPISATAPKDGAS